MSRHPRLVFPGVPLHIIQRGNNRNPCFFKREDYQVYLALLADSALEFDCPVHAYVLMTNHVHILATPLAGDAASSMMKRVGQNYVQYINRSRQRFGTLWQGRYRSCLVQEDKYFLACHRYIELNPVRAGIVTHPAQYEWSSYRANATGEHSTLITPHPAFTAIAASREERQQRYRELFAQPLSFELIEEMRHATNGNRAVGSMKFVDSVSAVIGRDLIPQRAGRRPL